MELDYLHQEVNKRVAERVIERYKASYEIRKFLEDP